MYVSLLFLLLCLPVNCLSAQHVELKKSKSVAPPSRELVAANHAGPTFDVSGIAIELFRAKFCASITQNVSPQELVINTRWVTVTKHEFAKYSWDVISFAFIQSMKGKEIDDIWYPSFKSANNLLIKKQIASYLRKKTPQNLRVTGPLPAVVKDHLPLVLAETIMWGAQEFALPLIKKNALSFMRIIIDKTKTS